MAITTSNHPQRLINAYRRGTRGDEYTKEAVKSSFDSLLTSLGSTPPCGPTCGEHGCTSHFLQPEVRKSVLNFILDHGYKEKPDRDRVVMTMYRGAKTGVGHKKNGKLHFPVPYINDENTPLSPEWEKELCNHRLCHLAIQSLFGIGESAWKTLRRQASKSAAPKPHGNRGKGRKGFNNPTNNSPVVMALREFFADLEKQGEPRATRIVREEVGETTIRDHDDKAIWIPMTCGKRTMYRKYCESQGWQIITYKNGKLRKKWIGGDRAKTKVCSYGAFHKFWAISYPHIKTSSQREDVCTWCYIFANKARYAAFQNSTCVEIRESTNTPNPAEELTSKGSDVAPVEQEAVTEELILEAVRHVQAAKAQREYLQKMEAKAVSDNKNNVPHCNRTYVITLDYAQNAGIPHLGKEQPGITYYLQNYNGYILGIVDAAHRYNEEKVGHFMNAYLYEEWEGGKGSNNVASLLLMALREQKMMREDDEGNPVLGGSLSIFCDNCSGQNKNNTVLRMAAYLVECGYFKKVEVVFLIVGHTKQSCDRLFNNMKAGYRGENVMSFSELTPILNNSHLVQVHNVTHRNFQDWTTLLDEYYYKITAVKVNHIFEVNTRNVTTDNKGKKHVVMTIREADLPDAQPIRRELKKRGPLNNRLPNEQTPETEDKPARNAMKIVNFHKKWRGIIPAKYHSEMCPQPTEEEIAAAAQGKKSLKSKDKKKKKRVLQELEQQALGSSKKAKTTHQKEDTVVKNVNFDVDDSSDDDDDEFENVCLARLARMKRIEASKVGQDSDESDCDSSDDEGENIALAVLARSCAKRG